MEEYTQITLDMWQQWKEDIRNKLAEAAGNFVHIGYRLKQIRDSGMYDGCTDVFEFAQKEYGLGKSTVSRFIAINEKFSEGGNSLELRAEYKAIGSSKLAEMLTLSESECQLITERTTVKEIRELKQFDRQQVQEDDQKNGKESDKRYTPLQKCIMAFFSQKDKRETLNKVMELIEIEDFKEAAGVINPGEYATFKKGIIFIFMYDYATGVKYKEMGQPDPVSISWTEFLADIEVIYREYCHPETDTWINFYGEPAEEPSEQEEKQPEKDVKQDKTEEDQDISVATSQQKSLEEMPAEVVQSESQEQEEEQLPGQIKVEDFPEKLPDNYEEIKENADNDDTGAADSGADDHADQNHAGGTAGEVQPDGAGDSDKAENVDGGHDDVSDGLGAAGNAGESEEVPDREPLNEISNVQQDYHELWMDVRKARTHLTESIDYLLRLAPGEEDPYSPGFASLEEVQDGYDKAVNLAAAIEKVLIARQREKAKQNG